MTVLVFGGNAMPSSISGILSSSVLSVEYSTATFRDLQVWSTDDRLEEAVLSPLFLFLEVRGCSVCSLLSLWVGPVSPCVSDKVDSISCSSEELLTHSTLVCCKSWSRFAFTRGLLCMSHETPWLPPNVVRKIACPFYDVFRFYTGLNHAAQSFHQSETEGMAWRNAHVPLITFSHRESMEADYGSSHSSSSLFSFYSSSLLTY